MAHRPRPPIDIPSKPYPEPYMYYHEERYIKLVKGHPSLTKLAIGQIIAEEWEKMDKKKHEYFRRMQELAIEYYNDYKRHKEMKQGQDNYISDEDPDSELRKITGTSGMSRNKRRLQEGQQGRRNDQIYDRAREAMNRIKERSNRNRRSRNLEDELSEGYSDDISGDQETQLRQVKFDDNYHKRNNQDQQRKNYFKQQGRQSQQKSGKIYDEEEHEVFRSHEDGRLHDQQTGQFVSEHDDNDETNDQQSTRNYQRSSSGGSKQRNSSGSSQRKPGSKLKKTSQQQNQNQGRKGSMGGYDGEVFRSEKDGRLRAITGQYVSDPDAKRNKKKGGKPGSKLNQNRNENEGDENQNQEGGSSQGYSNRQKKDKSDNQNRQSNRQSNPKQSQQEKDEEEHEVFRSSVDGRVHDQHTGQYVTETQNEDDNQNSNRDQRGSSQRKGQSQTQNKGRPESKQQQGSQDEGEDVSKSATDERPKDKKTGNDTQPQGQDQKDTDDKSQQSQKDQDDGKQNIFRSQADGRLHDKNTGQFVPQDDSKDQNQESQSADKQISSGKQSKNKMQEGKNTNQQNSQGQTNQQNQSSNKQGSKLNNQEQSSASQMSQESGNRQQQSNKKSSASQDVNMTGPNQEDKGEKDDQEQKDKKMGSQALDDNQISTQEIKGNSNKISRPAKRFQATKDSEEDAGQKLSPTKSAVSSEQTRKDMGKQGPVILIECSTNDMKYRQCYKIARDALEKAIESVSIGYKPLNGTRDVFNIYLSEEQMIPIWGKGDPIMNSKNVNELVERIKKHYQ